MGFCSGTHNKSNTIFMTSFGPLAKNGSTEQFTYKYTNWFYDSNIHSKLAFLGVLIAALPTCLHYSSLYFCQKDQLFNLKHLREPWLISSQMGKIPNLLFYACQGQRGDHLWLELLSTKQRVSIIHFVHQAGNIWHHDSKTKKNRRGCTAHQSRKHFVNTFQVLLKNTITAKSCKAKPEKKLMTLLSKIDSCAVGNFCLLCSL